MAQELRNESKARLAETKQLRDELEGVRAELAAAQQAARQAQLRAELARVKGELEVAGQRAEQLGGELEGLHRSGGSARSTQEAAQVVRQLLGGASAAEEGRAAEPVAPAQPAAPAEPAAPEVPAGPLVSR